MPFNEVYIVKTASFFPNDPVSNDEMEEYLGYINNHPSKSKKIVLRNNGIKRRFYALTKEGTLTHTNAQMTAEAVRALFSDPEQLKSIELLCCGTSSPDQLMPSHAVMVHGELPQTHPMEVISLSGVCCAGMHAFKYAYMAVKTGEVSNAVTTGSERFSRVLRSDIFEDEAQKLKELEENPYIGFEKEFLRWMLSDGASAFLLKDKPNPKGLSLRVEWLEGISYANEMEACMYMGSDKMKDGHLKSYMDYTPEELVAKSIFSIKQDVKLLSEHIIPFGGNQLKSLIARKGLNLNEVDYFLPHISSEFFKSKIFDHLQKNDMPIPYEKWLINLTSLGNVGAASVYFMVDELFKRDSLRKGQKVLLMVPESARFSYVYGLLTVC
jgi:3-oxoacyl-[acyl-carrier-protein] synthase III